MVMPSSGPISMFDAHREFGLGYSLSAYYGCDIGVPTSGPIALSHLYGKRKAPAFSFIKIYNLTNSNYVPASAHAFYEFEFRNVAGGADYLVACDDCSPIDGSSGPGRAALADNNLSSWARFPQSSGNTFMIFRLSQKIAIREIAIYNYSVSSGATTFSVGGADTLAELQSGNGTFLGTGSAPAGQSAGAWRTFPL